MTFKNTKELKSYIFKKSESAMIQAQSKVYQIVNTFVKEFYVGYSPAQYERTYQLYQSLIKSDVQISGNSIIATVYFDASRLDYYMKVINGKESPNHGWSAETVLNVAMISGVPHGGYSPAGGNGIYLEAIAKLNQEAIKVLKDSLVSAGIPIR